MQSSDGHATAGHIQGPTLDRGSFADNTAENARTNIPQALEPSSDGDISPKAVLAEAPNDMSLPIETLAPSAGQAVEEFAAGLATTPSIEEVESIAGDKPDDYSSRNRIYDSVAVAQRNHCDSLARTVATMQSISAMSGPPSHTETRVSSVGKHWQALKQYKDTHFRRTGNKKEKGLTSLVPILSSALQAPFAIMNTAEKDRRMIPVVLELLKVTVMPQDEIIDDTTFALPTTQNAPFVILCEYGPSKWVVKKTIYDFLGLHSRLSIRRLKGSQKHFKTELPIPKFPSQATYAFASFREHQSHSTTKAALANRYLAMQAYLRKLLISLNMHMYGDDVCAFLCISSLSFHPLFVHKPLEVSTKVRSIHTKVLWSCLPVQWSTWSTRWALLGPSFIALLSSPSDRLVGEIIMMDNTFEVAEPTHAGCFIHHPKIERHKHALLVSAGFTRFEFAAETEKMKNFWQERMTRTIEMCVWGKDHRFDSFAPVRRLDRASGRTHEQLLNAQGGVGHKGGGSFGTAAKWFVDGHDYFEAVAEAINSATDHIYISDWWLSPELYMKRPPCENKEWRLDRLLLKKAQQGVYIYILLYKEITMALSINSYHSKFALVDLHPNIKIQRHPDVITSFNLSTAPFWAHHEKLVVVDDLLTFIGGLDLCYGRYDTFEHAVTDISAPIIFHGQDYSNPRIADFRDVGTAFSKELIDRNVLPRMGWHDVALMMTSCPDVSRHFVQRWNYVKYSKALQRRDIPFLLPPLDIGNSVLESDADITPQMEKDAPLQFQLVRSIGYWSCGVKTECSIARAYENLISKADYFIYIENQFFVTSCDAGGSVRNRIGNAMFERIMRAHTNGEKFRIIVLMPLLPAFESGIDTNNAATIRLVMTLQYESISKGEFSLFGKLHKHGVDPAKYIGFFALRSYGCINPAAAAAAATLTADAGSITSDDILPTGDTFDMSGSHSNLSVCLEEDITEETNSLLDQPDTASNTSSHVSASLAIPQDIQPAGSYTAPLYRTQSTPRGRHRSTTLNKIAEFIMSTPTSTDTRAPMSSEALITESSSSNVKKLYVTEQCYIHAKLMIVDDRAMICGSANLNDRSMLGYRDSELGFVIEGGPPTEISMDGEKINVSKFINELRTRLMLEHLGALEEDHNVGMAKDVDEKDQNKRNIRPEDVQDVLSDTFYEDVWCQSAKVNTNIFRKLFACVPDDTVHNWDQYRAFVKDGPIGHLASQLPMEKVESELSQIQGRLVIFPTEFLVEENLGSSLLNKERLIPNEVFA